MNKKVVITGGSGFLGNLLSKHLLLKGYNVVSLDLVPPRDARVMFVEADMADGIPKHHYLEKPTYVINLAGEPIFGRWTNNKKEAIYHTRITGTNNLINLFSNPLYRPEALVSASAVGIYGDAGTMNVDERSELGEGFLARVAIDWEAAAKTAEGLGVRTTIIRNGHIIGHGGLMAKLRPFYNLHVVPQVVAGQVCLSWIHETDVVQIYHQAMEEPTAPPVINAVAPKISTFGEFSRIIAAQSHAAIFKVPRFFAETVMGDLVVEMGYGQCVKTTALSNNFKYRYPVIDKAIREVIGS